ncbi:helix-turn-helix transcriptional regulator [Pseudonocardia nematodicida]|uniref:Helix-turn-helix transcriptional regulator n=1 Tax=Pseudonocardia nematodicida TaxID=1206997 RepID=A0ABV1KJ70_9PSEU
MAPTPLGEYLRARRAQVSPGDAGLPAGSRRRVAGLRREEVALLAGMSADYYVRLEQGRERNPSVQVLDALADVLRLDHDARDHLLRLAGAVPRRRRSGSRERVDPQLRMLLDAWAGQPAIVLGRAYDVLAANALGGALLDLLPAGVNLLERVFCDPAARSFYADWDAAARDATAGFRLRHGEAPDDPRVRAVLDDVRERSPEFARLWARHDARGKAAGTKRLVHPAVGELDLRMETFDVRSAPGQELVVYHAEPGSDTARNLALLGTLAADATREWLSRS